MEGSLFKCHFGQEGCASTHSPVDAYTYSQRTYQENLKCQFE